MPLNKIIKDAQENHIEINDIVLKVNAITVNVDNQTVSKLLEIIEMLRENQIILLNKIDLIEIFIIGLANAKGEITDE